ncbi:MAG: hypothetical protein KVP17_002588 [Porospora cf. gigantea B]|uniref:uncharacterized protein n=1 Tax=Porospora cf. gigantea B TaxID=2853592 RepID=UPI003571AEAB|nr:MAG: hypothetical protein KVP17_002588 [Porospora cf. gigantea B]
MLSLEDATLKWAASRCQISQIEKRLADCSRMLFEAQAGASATELRKRLQLANQQLATLSTSAELSTSQRSRVQVLERQQQMIQGETELLDTRNLPGGTVAAQLTGQRDEQLQQLSISAQRLNKAANTINEELELQQRMLISLDEEVDLQGAQMGAVMDRMSKVFKTNNRKQLSTILWLSIGLVLLLLLVIFA